MDIADVKKLFKEISAAEVEYWQQFPEEVWDEIDHTELRLSSGAVSLIKEILLYLLARDKMK